MTAASRKDIQLTWHVDKARFAADKGDHAEFAAAYQRLEFRPFAAAWLEGMKPKWFALSLLLGGLAAAHAAPPSLQPLRHGEWPAWPRGTAQDVAVVGNYAYVAVWPSGVAVMDVSNPSNVVHVGGCGTRGLAQSVALAGNLLFVAADDAGLLVLPTVPNVQFTVRVDEGTLGTPYTIEVAAGLREPIQWSPLLTTNPPALPFDFVDFDVTLTEKPQKFYRVRQP